MHLYHLTIGIFLFLFTNIHAAYNPIPIGSVIISTKNRIVVMQPKEYGGTNDPKTIYGAPSNVTILYSIYDSSARDLYVIYTNSTTGIVYLSQLALIEQLDSSVYQLPITFNISMVNRYSFSSDIINRRLFLTDDKGVVTLLSMSGLLKATIPSPITNVTLIRSVAYNNFLNRFFFITDTTVNSCVSTDDNTFQCCEAVSRGIAFRSIEFDQIGGETYVYVLDQKAGIYQVSLNTTGCPTALRLINTMISDTNLHFAVDRGLYFASGSVPGGTENSNLYIANGTATPRQVPIGETIVALDISMPLVRPTFSKDGTCFHGVSYSTYRAAVVLAAIFGTIMGIFMCFNVLFCIDFFMTKRIIRDLKKQIPHNLLEDRWNKLIEEKYAKIALERARKKDDPPSRRKSSAAARPAIVVTSDSDNRGRADTLQVSNAIPKLSDYIRRKSEGYLNRRRSDDPRSQRNQAAREQFTDVRTYPARQQLTTNQGNIQPVQEENESSQKLRQNLSRRELLKDDDFL